MTVAPTNTQNQTIDALCKKAMQMSGVVDSNADINSAHMQPDLIMCRTFLQSILNKISTDAPLRFIRFQEVALTAGTYKYTLAATVLDVLGDAMYIEPGEDTSKASGETLVAIKSMDHWHKLSDKSAPGRPTQMFVYRQAPIELRLYPIPDAAGTLRIQAHEQPADSIYGTYNVDLEPYWFDYIETELAKKFAFAKGHDAKGQLLMVEARDSYRRARSKAASSASSQTHVGHNTGWTR